MSDAAASLTTSLADRYTIERVLGYGGMATVHLAEERKHKRKVAIKVLKQEFGASVGAERFLREILDRAIAMNPTAEETFRIQGLILTLDKQYAAAERVLREALALAPECGSYSKVTLAYSLACAGDRSYAKQIAAELEERRKTEYVSPVELATVHIALGDAQRALDWMEAAVDDRRGWSAYLRVHPILDPLRGEPRFDALVQRMKFDAAVA